MILQLKVEWILKKLLSTRHFNVFTEEIDPSVDCKVFKQEELPLT
jgi:hypothetical protein